jgi:hypothetical protein
VEIAEEPTDMSTMFAYDIRVRMEVDDVDLSICQRSLLAPWFGPPRPKCHGSCVKSDFQVILCWLDRLTAALVREPRFPGVKERG